ncbi:MULTISPECIES: hypothetical protein [unclassified Polaribacter]|nr:MULTISPECIES: hypothetical protein [unclassified Polaribacter]
MFKAFKAANNYSYFISIDGCAEVIGVAPIELANYIGTPLI